MISNLLPKMLELGEINGSDSIEEVIISQFVLIGELDTPNRNNLAVVLNSSHYKRQSIKLSKILLNHFHILILTIYFILLLRVHLFLLLSFLLTRITTHLILSYIIYHIICIYHILYIHLLI